MNAILHRLLTTLCVILSSTGLNAQTTASEYYLQGDAFHAFSDFSAALEKYDQSRVVALESEDYKTYFNAFGMVLDCLQKKMEIRLLEIEIDSMSVQLSRFQYEVPIPFYHGKRDVTKIFAVLVLKAYGDSEGALILLHSMLDSLNDLLPESNPMAINVKKIKLQLYISEVFLAQGNYEQTMYYANEAIILSTSMPNADGWLLTPHNTLVANYVATGQTNEAIKELNLILEIIPGLKERRTERMVAAYLKVSDLHLTNGNLDSAIYYIKLLKSIDQTGSHAFDAAILEGEIQYSAGEYEKSKLVYLDLHQMLVDLGAEQSEKNAICLLQLGKIAIKQGRLQDALLLIHDALLTSTENFNDSDLSSIPKLDALHSRLSAAEIIFYKSKVLYALYDTLDTRAFLVASWKNAILGVDLVDKLRKSYYNTEDKAFLIEQSYRIFEHALRICHAQLSLPNNEAWVDTAFTLMERSKALNLMDAVMHESARQFAGIPDSLLKTETALRLEISGQKESIRQLKSSKKYSALSLRKSNSVLHDKERLYRTLLQEIEKDHPRYYRLRYGASKICLNDIQSLLGENETVIEYFVAETDIYTLVVEKTRKQLFVNHNAPDIEGLMLKYRSAIQACIDGEGNKATDSLYLNSAVALYDSLIRPVLPIQKTIIVIQDGALNYLSFAGLISEIPEQYYDFRTQAYMLWDHQISYCYSMSLYRELQQKQESKAEMSLVFAPEFEEENTLGQLKFNEAEALHVARQTSGKILSGVACTAFAVREQLKGSTAYQVIHFATHGVADIANGKDSYLQFAGPADSNRLYARELYNYSLGARLVYLSACETGGGQLRRGEGIISIARAFFYAGTRSLVTALWSISDERAKDLTISFYDELMSGESIDGSVARAQRSYLQNISVENRSFAHPAYWSALIPIGSTTPIVPGSNWLWLLLLIGVAALSIILLILYKKRAAQG